MYHKHVLFQVQAEIDVINASWDSDGSSSNLADSLGLMVYEGTQALNYVKNYANGSGQWQANYNWNNKRIRLKLLSGLPCHGIGTDQHHPAWSQGCLLLLQHHLPGQGCRRAGPVGYYGLVCLGQEWV